MHANLCTESARHARVIVDRLHAAGVVSARHVVVNGHRHEVRVRGLRPADALAKLPKWLRGRVSV